MLCLCLIYASYCVHLIKLFVKFAFKSVRDEEYKTEAFASEKISEKLLFYMLITELNLVSIYNTPPSPCEYIS